MRTVVQALREMLDPRIVQPGALELHEDDPGSTIAPTKLESPGQAVALRFSDWAYAPDTTIPTNRWLFPLFDVRRGDPPVCRSCDYIVFHAPRGAPSGPLFVFLCELKSGRAAGSRPQIRNGKLLADYVLSVVKLHGAVAAWPSDVRFRGLVFARSARGTRGSLRAPAVAEYIDDERTDLDLRVTTQRPGQSYPIQFFCV